MQAYPGAGNPLQAALRGEITPRQLRVMLSHLPTDNPVERELQGHGWTDITNILWNIEARLREYLTAYESVNSPKGHQVADPVYLPHPGDDQQHVESAAEQAQHEAERKSLEGLFMRAQIEA